ncbi:MAG: YceI family protein [Bacteroidota bacterium]
MKKLFISLAVISFYAFKLADVAYTADTKASNIHWLGKKTNGQHEGDVKLLRGKINFNNSAPVDGEFVLDMNSISVTDIKDPENNKSLVNHLKEADFFDVAANPTATITLKKFEKSKDQKADAPNYNVTADLIIKGIKNEIQFPAKINVSADKTTANADLTIDRTKWNIVYKSKSILGSAADKFIYDDITFSVNLVLQK